MRVLGGLFLAVLIVGLIGVIGYEAAPTPVAASPSAPLTKAEQVKAGYRVLTARAVERSLLSNGIDAQTSIDPKDNTLLIVYGKGISRPVAFNLMTTDVRKTLKMAGFTSVLFASADYSFSQKYTVN